jgi:DNA/RNA endonuclease G (NUC1)/PKD repeat protein
VSWNINASHFGGAPRCNCFSADQTLPNDVYHVVDFDYRNGGYDRGHMVQSESRTTTDQENASTFLLTNILPQGAENNQGPWSKFENYLNDLARLSGKEIYVVAGGEYSASPGTLKGEGKVAIPDYTWKVAVIMNAGQGLADVHSAGDLQVIAIKMPNLTDPAAAATSVGMRNNPWEQYKVTVNQIELETGYDLLSALPNQIEVLVEANDRAPAAATDGPYTGMEGAPVSLSGSASTDPDGDVLTYNWDFGDGTTGTGVTPQHSYADNGNYVVTLTVSDPAGAEATATTSVTVFNVAPAVNAFAGASILAHQTYAGGGSFTDAGADEWTATVDYGDGSGTQPLALSGTGFNLSHTYDHGGTFTITVTVTDDDGASASKTATVTVTNVAPTVNAFAGATLLPGESYSATGSFTDPGPDSWTATVNYGDGSGTQPLALSGTGFSLGHTYTAAGTYTVTVTVTDDGGMVGTQTATVTVLTGQQGIGNLIVQTNGMVSGGGPGASLAAKLRAAGASLDRGNIASATGQLGAFIEEVRAMVQSGRLSQANGAALIAAAQRIVDSIN